MRYVAMQALTWGTIAGAIGSALLLAALENPAPRYYIELPNVVQLPSEPPQAGRARPRAAAAVAPSAAASTPKSDER